MKACKILWLDFKEGVLKNKRICIMIFIVILYSMITHISLDIIWKNIPLEYGKYSLFELFWFSFNGCDPLIKSKVMMIPYPWLALYICPIFMTFDYIQQDLIGYGSQILIRIGDRKQWWYQKCIWCFLATLWTYFIIWITMLLFCVTNQIPISFAPNQNTFSALACGSICYTPVSEMPTTTKPVIIYFIICPFLAMFTLELLTMVLTLFIRPAIAFIISVGVLTLSITFDWSLLFPRIGMLMENDIIYADGYPVKKGIIICVIVIFTCVICGEITFRQKDILPGKEEET